MEKLISNIVFTMNRPLQLEAYLRSLRRHLPAERIQTYVLYKPGPFDEQYDSVFRHFADCVVLREKGFREDLLSLVEGIRTKYVVFGTDDVVYHDGVSLDVIDETFETFSRNILGFSLRLDWGRLREGGDRVTQVRVRGQDVFRVNWKQGRVPEARYPFEVNSTVYRTSRVQEIVRLVAQDHPRIRRIFPPESLRVRFLRPFISMKDLLVLSSGFHDPNTLEGHGARWCKAHRRRLPDYLYFQKPCACAIQINRVNTTVDNPTDGSAEHEVESLNEMFKQGYRFDVRSLEESRPRETHVGRQYFRLIRQPD